MSTHSTTSSAQKYQDLRLQVPVMEFTESTTDEIIEPFPMNAGKWLKLSQMAFAASIGLALLGIALVAVAGKGVIKAQDVLNQGPLKTERAIRAADAEYQQLMKSGLVGIVQRGAIFKRASLAFQGCTAWSMNVDSNGVVFDYTLSPEKDPLDVLTSLDKAMLDAGFRNAKPGSDKENEPHRHTTTYVRQ